MPAPQFDNPKTVAPPAGAYTHVVRVAAGSEIIFFAGQVGMTPDGALPESFADQVDAAIGNLVRLLEAEGLTPKDLVKTNLYLVAGNDLAAVRAARARHFGDAQPASTLVYVPQLATPQYLFEIEGVACR